MLEEQKKNIIFVCSECGSEDIQEKFWINPNTKEVAETAVLDSDDLYCNDCKQHFPHITEDEYAKREGIENETTSRENEVEIEQEEQGCPFDEELK